MPVESQGGSCVLQTDNTLKLRGDSQTHEEEIFYYILNIFSFIPKIMSLRGWGDGSMFQDTDYSYKT